MSTAATLPVGAHSGLNTGNRNFRFALDPRTSVIGFISVAVLIGTTDRFVPLVCYCVGLFILVVFSRGQSRKSPIQSRYSMLWVFLAALITIAFYVIFGPKTGGRSFHFVGIGVEQDAILLGLTMAARLVALMLLSGLLLIHVSPLMLATGIARICMPLRHIGVPVASFFHLAFFLTRMIPELIRESQLIAIAQRARGVSLRNWKSYPALALPLFASALRRSDNAALLLASRGFDSRRIPSHVRALRFSAVDFVVLALLTLGGSVWFYLLLK